MMSQLGVALIAVVSKRGNYVNHTVIIVVLRLYLMKTGIKYRVSLLTLVKGF